MDDSNEIPQWSEEARLEFSKATQSFVTAMLSHSRTLLGLAGRQSEYPAIFSSNDSLARSALNYADAQFALSGTMDPFGALPVELAEGEEQEVGSEDQPVALSLGQGLSIQQRADYVVTDEAMVLASGRAAYLQTWPEDTEEDAAFSVIHIGHAVYEVAHAGSWEQLDDLDGLEPRGRIVWVTKRDPILGHDHETWPEEPYVLGEDEQVAVIYTQLDVF
jgi:hypothetical protein